MPFYCLSIVLCSSGFLHGSPTPYNQILVGRKTFHKTLRRAQLLIQDRRSIFCFICWRSRQLQGHQILKQSKSKLHSKIKLIADGNHLSLCHCGYRSNVLLCPNMALELSKPLSVQCGRRKKIVCFLMNCTWTLWNNFALEVNFGQSWVQHGNPLSYNWHPLNLN